MTEATGKTGSRSKFTNSYLFHRSKEEVEDIFYNTKDLRSPRSYDGHSEEELLTRLANRDSKVAFCQYMTYKIYHFILMFHKIELSTFLAEFRENEFGDYEFNNAKIYHLVTDIVSLHGRKEVKSNALMEETTYLTGKLVQKGIVEDKRSLLRRHVNSTLELSAEDTSEDQIYEKDESDPQELMDKLKKQYSDDFYQKNLFSKMKNYMRKTFHNMVEGYKAQNCSQQLLKACEEVYQELMPEVNVKLKDIIAKEYIEPPTNHNASKQFIKESVEQGIGNATLNLSNIVNHVAKRIKGVKNYEDSNFVAKLMKMTKEKEAQGHLSKMHQIRLEYDKFMKLSKDRTKATLQPTEPPILVSSSPRQPSPKEKLQKEFILTGFSKKCPLDCLSMRNTSKITTGAGFYIKTGMSKIYENTSNRNSERSLVDQRTQERVENIVDKLMIHEDDGQMKRLMHFVKTPEKKNMTELKANTRDEEILRRLEGGIAGGKGRGKLSKSYTDSFNQGMILANQRRAAQISTLKNLEHKRQNSIALGEETGFIPLQMIKKQFRMKKISLNASKWKWVPSTTERAQFLMVNESNLDSLEGRKEKIRKRRLENLQRSIHLPRAVLNGLLN